MVYFQFIWSLTCKRCSIKNYLGMFIIGSYDSKRLQTFGNFQKSLHGYQRECTSQAIVQKLTYRISPWVCTIVCALNQICMGVLLFSLLVLVPNGLYKLHEVRVGLSSALALNPYILFPHNLTLTRLVVICVC